MRRATFETGIIDEAIMQLIDLLIFYRGFLVWVEFNEKRINL